MSFNHEAAERYRKLWGLYKSELETGAKKHVLEGIAKCMDKVQTEVCRGPCVEWQRFAKSLPGFVEFWDSFRKNSKKFAGKIRGE